MRRPKDKFLKFMAKIIKPPEKRREYIRRCIDGGVRFEEEYLEMMGDTKSPFGYTWDADHKVPLTWIYVGDLWWCRRRANRYEFGQLMAIKNVKSSKVVYDGLWDDRKHRIEKESVILFRGTEKGYVVGWNKYELIVQWGENGIRSTQEPLKSLDGIVFKYDEDDRYYRKLLEK